MKNSCLTYNCENELTYPAERYCSDHKKNKNNIYNNTHLQSTYKVWMNLMTRIKLDPYGMDPKWKTFKGFMEDMGIMPEGAKFCKVYSGEGYYKGNCQYKVKKVKE